MITLGDEGSASYQFDIDEAGVYDIAVRVCFPFWDKNSVTVSVDGISQTFSEDRLWWPYWRTTCWFPLVTGHSFSAGTHTLTVDVGVNGVQFYGFRVCTAFSEDPTAGVAQFTLSPRQFIDVDGNPCKPDKGFKLTCEMLRRKPDSALIWYEDFRDDTILPSSYWTTLFGEWDTLKRRTQYGRSQLFYSRLP